MKGIVLTQPAAYLTGVVAGDGWCTRILGLHVSDEDFAQAFSVAIRCLAPEVLARPILEGTGHWRVRSSNATGRWDYLRPGVSDPYFWDLDAVRAWLLGYFDSEGNALLRDSPTLGPRSKGRRVAVFSTERDTLDLAQDLLRRLDIPARHQPWSSGVGHIGSKPVGALEVRGSRENYARFAELVGSNIARKQAVLDALPLSYQPDGFRAEIALRSVAKRKARQAAGGRY